MRLAAVPAHNAIPLSERLAQLVRMEALLDRERANYDPQIVEALLLLIACWKDHIGAHDVQLPG